MIRHVFAATALLGLVLAAYPSPAAAQMSGSTATTQQHKPAKAMGHRGSMSKKMGPGHRMDNIADKLNACQQKAQAERKMCMDQATGS